MLCRCVVACVIMGMECRLMCVHVVRRMVGAQVYSLVRWLFGCGLVGVLVVLIVPLLCRSWRCQAFVAFSV